MLPCLKESFLEHSGTFLSSFSLHTDGGREPQSPRGIAGRCLRTPRASGCFVSCLSGAGSDPAVCFIFSVYFWRGHTGIKYKEPEESCPKHSVRCDGVVDCKLKSDELGCGKEAGHGYACACVRVCTLVTANCVSAQTGGNGQRIRGSGF